MLRITKDEIADLLATFIWSYKVGDNIAHNFKILFLLYQKREETPGHLRVLLNKPIAVTIVSIIEGVFYDLICLLGESTNHFPSKIEARTAEKI